jgi:uncharacterized protein with ParB-like and HNH nuclease domain
MDLSYEKSAPVSITKPALSLKTISELLGRKFFIPDYQRGYRWKPRQVEDLLDDVHSFHPKELAGPEPKSKTWYFLQPLAVALANEDVKRKYGLSSKEEFWEVIDGQQRLTTIFLIAKFLNKRYQEEDRRQLFELHYATRERSWNFLNNLVNEKETDNTNIDFSHMSEAYKKIAEWFRKRNSDPHFNSLDFESKFYYSTKVIWYEDLADDAIALFTRINNGKIPLTNAELIKALFLNSSNFQEISTYDINLKQTEIAQEWDAIEYALKNPAFWYFINEKDNHLDTRIEYIFNLMSGKPVDDPPENDNHTFNFFNAKFTHYSLKEVIANWEEVKVYYQALKEWFEDRELYHKIGFLITYKEKIPDLLLLQRDITKKAFRGKLDSLICKKLKRVQLSQLAYPDGKIRRVLLLHNIQTMMDNEKEISRFPFDRYKSGRWDIEHINAVGEEMPDTEIHQMDWLKETVKFLNGSKELLERSTNYKKNEFAKLYRDILHYFIEKGHPTDVGGMGNLVLLNSKINRGYKNAVYPVKRKEIILNDRKGTFIPICTRNVFLKFYSTEVDQMTFWGEKEQDNYYNDIKRVLGKYLPKQLEAQDNDNNE